MFNRLYGKHEIYVFIFGLVLDLRFLVNIFSATAPESIRIVGIFFWHCTVVRVQVWQRRSGMRSKSTSVSWCAALYQIPNMLCRRNGVGTS